MFKAKIHITLRESILDPKGKATHHALTNLGFTGIEQVRIGKLIEMTIQADDETRAHEIAEQACQKLLANDVMEDYTIYLTRLESQT